MNNTNTEILYVSIDTEFVEKEFVSLQMVFVKNRKEVEKRIIINKSFLSPSVTERVDDFCEKAEILFFPEDRTDTSLLVVPHIIDFIAENYNEEEISSSKFTVNLLFFYSFKDLEFCFGFENLKNYLTLEKPRGNKNWILQGRSIMGKLKKETTIPASGIKFRFRDLKGFAQFGLLELASSLGFQMENKGDLDEYKCRMDLALQEHPETFVKYAMGDAEILYPILNKMMNYTNDILLKSLRLPYFMRFTPHTMKYSNGSLVATSFEKYIEYYSCGKPKNWSEYKERKRKVELAFAKLSVLKISSNRYGEYLHFSWKEWRTI